MTQQPMTKAEKRAAAKEAKAAARRRARNRKRLRAAATALAGVAVLAVIVAAFVFLGPDEDPDPAADPGATATASAAAEPTGQAFPPLPEGADPALATRPTVPAGTGEVTKLTGTTIVAGNGPPTQNGQMVTVNYVGARYATGEEFDASWNSEQPYTFPLGAGDVIPGWDRGLVGVRVGSRVQLDIPADLAYGENPEGGRPAGPLRFIVDVLAVQQ